MSRRIIIILINIHIRKENANKTEDLKQRNQMNSYLLMVILVTCFLTSTALLVPASARIIASANGTVKAGWGCKAATQRTVNKIQK